MSEKGRSLEGMLRVQSLVTRGGGAPRAPRRPEACHDYFVGPKSHPSKTDDDPGPDFVEVAGAKPWPGARVRVAPSPRQVSESEYKWEGGPSDFDLSVAVGSSAFERLGPPRLRSTSGDKTRSGCLLPLLN